MSASSLGLKALCLWKCKFLGRSRSQALSVLTPRSEVVTVTGSVGLEGPVRSRTQPLGSVGGEVERARHRAGHGGGRGLGLGPSALQRAPGLMGEADTATEGGLPRVAEGRGTCARLEETAGIIREASRRGWAAPCSVGCDPPSGIWTRGCCGGQHLRRWRGRGDMGGMEKGQARARRLGAVSSAKWERQGQQHPAACTEPL